MRNLIMGLMATALLAGYWFGIREAAAAFSAGQNYVCVTTSVSSNSSPVAVLTPGRMTDWTLRVRASPASDPVLVFPYLGGVPTGTPSPAGVREINSSEAFGDQMTCNAPQCLYAMGEGWAAVLESGSTATTVDACSR